MVQGLISLADLPKDLVPVPGTHRSVHNHLQLQVQGIGWSLMDFSGTRHTHCIDIQTSKASLHIK